MSTVTIDVEYFPGLRELTGTGKERVTLPDGRLAYLLRFLSDRYGGAFRKVLLNDQSRLSQYIVILRNGLQVRDQDTVLEDGDLVTIMTTISGG